jgi:hypothetical protein
MTRDQYSACSATTVPAVALAKGVVRVMFLAKWKWLAVMLTAALLATVGASARRTAEDTQHAETRSDLETLVELDEFLSGHPWSVKKHTFDVNGKPWDKVFAWLTELTGKPVVCSFKPAGSLQLARPSTRPYSIFQILDLINEGLLSKENTQQYLLIHRERSFALVPASEPIAMEMVDRIRIEDLEKRGNSEFVSTIITFKALVATDIEPCIKKLVGPLGTAISVDTPNALVLLDTVKNLKHLRDTIKKLEDNE